MQVIEDDKLSREQRERVREKEIDRNTHTM